MTPNPSTISLAECASSEGLHNRALPRVVPFCHCLLNTSSHPFKGSPPFKGVVQGFPNRVAFVARTPHKTEEPRCVATQSGTCPLFKLGVLGVGKPMGLIQRGRAWRS